MGLKEWLLKWAKSRLLNHYSHHKGEVHKLTDIIIKQGSQDILDEWIKKNKPPTDVETIIRSYTTYFANEVDKRVDAGIDKWIEEQLGDGK